MIETVQPIRIILPDYPDHFADLHEVTFQTSFLRRVRYSTTKCGPNNWWEYTLYDSYQVGYQNPFCSITFLSQFAFHFPVDFNQLHYFFSSSHYLPISTSKQFRNKENLPNETARQAGHSLAPYVKDPNT